MMNILQFWIDGEPGEIQFNSLESAAILAKKHFLVTNVPDKFTDFPGLELIDYSSYMAEAMGVAGNPEFWLEYCGNGPRYISDFIRFTWPLIYGDIAYVDMDLILNGFPDILHNKAIFAEYGESAGIHLFYANNRIEFFRALLCHFEAQDPNCFLQAAFHCGWIRDNIEIIPSKYFEHVGH